MQTILILGTGKMAQNIGLFFLRKNFRVEWASRTLERAPVFAKKTGKNVRRLALIMDKPPENFKFNISHIDSIELKEYDLIIESVEEDLFKKKETISRITLHLQPDTILASNSSSILPVDIHEMTVGLHFFYPVELTGLVEIIFPDFIDPLKKKQILQIMESLDLYPVVQDTKNAFAINRLLLPVQAEAFRLLQQGYSAEMINICSKSARLKIGVFEMMDSVGLDVLLPAIKNYVSGMPVPEQEDYRILISGLKKLMQTGKLGKKNKNGILIGDSLPWEVNKDLMENKILLQDKLNNIFKKTCSRFVREKQLNAKELDEILNMVYS